MRFNLVWFDSFGAKSSCTLVETKDVNFLIDPGIAVMQPSFPAPLAKKLWWKEKGKKEIKRAAKNVDVIIISHYHWDHFLPEDLEIYRGKLILAKNPNFYINDSQRKRALEFYSKIFKRYGKVRLDDLLEKPSRRKFVDPFEKLKEAKEKDFGDYSKRRKELLKKGREWFKKRVEKWSSSLWIPEKKLEKCEVRFVEGKSFRFGRTRVRFTGPLFHGIEYSRVGWVFSTIIEEKKEKLIHSSDLNGPIIEDYASFILKENPKYLILDGPMTYMLGYTLNLINFRRVLENVKKIVEEVDFEVMIWDHHLPRERRFRERTKEIWELAKKLRKKVLVAREYKFGKRAVVEEL